MEIYMSACDKLMERVMDRIDYSNRVEASRVKIAVLDTGLDWNDSYIRGAKHRIVDWKNWADDRQDKDSQRQVHDGAGHGTHVAALLLKIAPEAKLYVSRVADQDGAMISPELIAKVSLHIGSLFNDPNRLATS
jgi:subtilisin family serine protease